ncbi:MAG TPA: DUF6498-containing protein [Bacteroidia bacterium]|jgi:hypothetical protein
MDRNTEIKSSRVALLLNNLLPLVGVLFLGWSGMEVLLLYWVESVVACSFEFLKMIRIMVYKKQTGAGAGNGTVTFFIAGFVYCLFLFAQYLAIIFFGIFAFELQRSDLSSGLFGLFASRPALLVPVFSTLLTYSIVYVRDFIRGGQYRHSELQEFIFAPVKRIMIIQFSVLGGGFIAVLLSRFISFDERVLKGIMVGIFLVVKNLADLASYRNSLNKSKNE